MDIGLILIVIGGIIVTFGDIALKKWVVTNKLLFYILGMGIYFIGTNFIAQSFKHKNIAVASVIFIIINAVLLSIVSWLYFKETLNTMQIIGIIVCLVGVVILELAA